MKKVLVLVVSLMFPLISLAAPVYSVTEASILVPLTGNNGEDLSALHEMLKQNLAAHWKTFTATPVTQGQLASTGEMVEANNVLYTVAMKCEAHETEKWNVMVRSLKETAQLDSVYVKQCNEHVQLF